MSDLTREERAAIEARHRMIPASVWDIPPSGGADDYRCTTCGIRDCTAARLLAALTAAETERDQQTVHAERLFARAEVAEARALPSDEEASLALTALAESVRHAAIMRTERVTIQAPLARYLLAVLATGNEPTDDGGQHP